MAFDPAIPPLPPLTISLVLAPAGQVDTGGGAVLSGTISCTTTAPVSVSVQVTLAQSSYGLSADSSTAAPSTCVASRPR